MKSDFYEELARLAAFLSVRVTFKDLWCAGIDQNGAYLREKPEWMTISNVFDTDLQAVVENNTGQIMEFVYRKYGRFTP